MIFNFDGIITTPQESDRLLKLQDKNGLSLPPETADLFIYGYGEKWQTPLILIQKGEKIDFRDGKRKPFWTLGRLIQIILKCTTTENTEVSFQKKHGVSMGVVIRGLEMFHERLDFSGLYENLTNKEQE